jgi:GntR family transcriptional regulator/MocR family aminotransferase
LDLLIEIDRAHPAPLQVQLFEAIRRLILDGRLRRGQRLPSTRELSRRYDMARNTVRLAYDRLIAEGYVTARAGGGTYVAGEVPDDALRAAAGDPAAVEQDASAAAMPIAFDGQLHDVFDVAQVRWDFALGRPDPSVFPRRAWWSAMRAMLGPEAARDLARYPDPQGLPALREAIADHLASARGLSVAADQIVVTAGSQEGLNLACRLCCDGRRPAAIEDPCYQGALYLLRSYGAQTVPVPVDDQGIDTARLPNAGCALLYVTPSHQYPTGGTLPLSRRQQLLEWAARTGSMLLEDDYDSDFRYTGAPLPALMGLEPNGRAMYLGTFSKSLGPGLRLGYLVVPRWLAARARIAKGLMNGGHAVLEQTVVARLLRSGAFESLLRQLRRVYDGRRLRLAAALRAHFGAVDLLGTDGGLHLAWRLPATWPDAATVQSVAAAVGVGVYTTRTGGSADQGSTEWGTRLLTLGYSSLGEAQIAQAIAALATAVRNSVFGADTGIARHAAMPPALEGKVPAS